jgi:hypothetical protein
VSALKSDSPRPQEIVTVDRLLSGLIGAPALGALVLFGSIVAFHPQAPVPSAESGPAERSILIEVFVREGSRQCDQVRNCIAMLRAHAPDLLVLGPSLRWGGCDGVLARLREDDSLPSIPVLLLSSVDR